MSDWIVADYISFLVDAVSSWLAYGIGFGAMVWVLSQVVGLIYRFVRY